MALDKLLFVVFSGSLDACILCSYISRDVNTESKVDMCAAVAGPAGERHQDPEYWIWTRQLLSSGMQRSVVIVFDFGTRHPEIASVVQEMSSSGKHCDWRAREKLERFTDPAWLCITCKYHKSLIANQQQLRT